MILGLSFILIVNELRLLSNLKFKESAVFQIPLDLNLGRIDASTNTIYKEIRRLDPAHELTFKLDSGIVSYKNFWDIEILIKLFLMRNSKF